MKKLAIVVSLLFAFLLAPAAGVMAQEVVDSGTTTENYTGINTSSDSVDLTLDYYDNYSNLDIYDETAGQGLTQGSDYEINGNVVTIYQGVLSVDSDLSVTYDYEVYENSNPFGGLSGGISLASIGGYVTELFSQIWALVALAIAIPLTFYVIRRLKGIFA